MKNKTSTSDLKHISEIIKKIDICMLTTINKNGSPHTRPMSNNKQVDFNGDLWFFTYEKTHKILEIEGKNEVSVAFSDVGNSIYLVLQGKGYLIKDKAKISELWKPELKVWFPKGLKEPGIALLKVDSTSAELWEGPSNFLSKLYTFGKALITGKKYEGVHKKINL